MKRPLPTIHQLSDFAPILGQPLGRDSVFKQLEGFALWKVQKAFATDHNLPTLFEPKPSSEVKRGGDRRGSNPQQPEPQSGALPLSYGRH